MQLTLFSQYLKITKKCLILSKIARIVHESGLCGLQWPLWPPLTSVTSIGLFGLHWPLWPRFASLASFGLLASISLFWPLWPQMASVAYIGFCGLYWPL